ncbi:MAG: 23S rRNA (pseudouridine(1915)-N(3))-methyltransferase RlmH [Bacteroidales bacterium]|nr:23S rRNA (pseudouridine(1915)-N(3))-methyltransferase RlmH [Bacteroidales bacterium]MBR3440553.1 23S rRNA (pseudouridine(1915)-N(3))-methyltransferase RlmH [Bacteroidales bacterium]
MKISLLTVGKTDSGWVREGLETYASRLRRYIPFSVIEIPDLKNAASLSKEQVKEKEGESILGNIGPRDSVILLDERGKEYTSIEFAKEIERMMVSGGKNIVFVTGGAFGFSDAVYARCDGKVSLSKMTFTHQMVRAVFTEQLYRAFTIIKGEPYHHE